ncbi:PREDICTED: transmembrane and coiled-coil domain-containing protein 4-like [Priapulus caudatus]|uniref:Transmembrane and coiled-coil domain-containing protein 4-like n=1 Tax=Priapulus caudatus TaxID=37621 RepID=A0ABM1E6A4_PRICU|nr:PREDICTED: transmembrane and coiled-coil domain-containing protein 4-like [Priapulus caudatus]
MAAAAAARDDGDAIELSHVADGLTDAGLFAYGALCAMTLHELFPERWFDDFRADCLAKVVRHLQLPAQIHNAMRHIADGDGGETSDAFVAAVLAEPSVRHLGDGRVVVDDLVRLAVRDGAYDARFRALVRHIAMLLRVAAATLDAVESAVVERLREFSSAAATDEERRERRRRERGRTARRYLAIGLGGLAGGALLGLTGGLAAPLLAAGAGAIVGTAGATALASTAGVAVIGSLFGVAGAGLTGYKMRRRVGAVEEFRFQVLTEGAALHVAVAVSGWLADDATATGATPDAAAADDGMGNAFRAPWSSLLDSTEQYCLCWESQHLARLGSAIDYLVRFGVGVAVQESLRYTILSSVLAAVAWPTSLISLSSLIDNPWSVCLQRSAAVGRQLADVLAEREHGSRPVTLVGFSLGASVIFACLQELERRRGTEGIVDEVVLLGAPAPGDVERWRPLARVVSGRIVNGYCSGDWLLKFLYRTTTTSMKVAGLGPIDWEDRRMHNVNLSDVVNGHRDYIKKLHVVLKAVGVRTADEVDPATPARSRPRRAIGRLAASSTTNDVRGLAPPPVGGAAEKPSRSVEALALELRPRVAAGAGAPACAAASPQSCDSATESCLEAEEAASLTESCLEAEEAASLTESCERLVTTMNGDWFCAAETDGGAIEGESREAASEGEGAGGQERRAREGGDATDG